MVHSILSPFCLYNYYYSNNLRTKSFYTINLLVKYFVQSWRIPFDVGCCFVFILFFRIKIFNFLNNFRIKKKFTSAKILKLQIFEFVLVEIELVELELVFIAAEERILFKSILREKRHFSLHCLYDECF